jgi:hypothetical protein
MAASQASWRCVQSHDREGWLALMAPDIVIEDPIGPTVTNPDGLGVRGKDAVAVAFRRISDVLPSGEFDAMEEFTDPETGLSLLLTRHWSRAQAKWFINMHCLYGYSAAVTTALKLFHTATT